MIPPNGSGVRQRGPAALVVGAINRPDILRMFYKCQGRMRLTFLDYRFNYGEEIRPDYYAPYGDVVSWDQFRDADDLLSRIAPERVVLFFNTSLNQVALNLAARRRGIPTFHLEHGFRLRFDEHDAFESGRPPRRRVKEFARRSWREASATLREHAFFWRSVARLDRATQRRAAAFALRVYRGEHAPRFRQEFGDIRRVDEYIAHAPEDFQQHWEEDGLDDANFRGVYYIGFPQFEYLCGLPAPQVDPRKVILIDHQFHNLHYFGWNLEFRRVWTARLAEIVKRLGLRLLVKRHPADTSDAWEAHLSPGTIEMLDYDGLREHICSTGLVLGNASSLQVPVAGMEHTVLVTLEIHPQPGHFLSKAFVKAGVAHAVHTFDELEQALADPERLRRAQAPNKARFNQNYMGPMDGAAAERLARIISDDTATGERVPAPLAAQQMRALLAPAG